MLPVAERTSFDAGGDDVIQNVHTACSLSSDKDYMFLCYYVSVMSFDDELSLKNIIMLVTLITRFAFMKK